MSPSQLKKLQELSYLFSQGKANHKHIQQLSALLAEINQYEEEQRLMASDSIAFIAAPRLC